MPKNIRVLHISTHHEPCGIGKFQEKCVKTMNEVGESVNDFYYLSLNKIKVLPSKDRKNEIKSIVSKSQEYDIVHIQHEFGFFYKSGKGFSEIVNALKSANKPIVTTIHTAPELLLASERLNSRTIRGIVGYALRKAKNKRTIKNKIKPLSSVDKVITFNNFTKNQLINVAGISPSNVYKTMLPVPSVAIHKNKRIRELMDAKSDDIILCTSGFINEYKGFDRAVKSLKYLPDTYKLAILGGINPDSGKSSVYDGISDLIISLGLEKRVYISGYIEDDEQLSVLMQGCDIALYPYDVKYYRLASSDAINKAIGCEIPIVAYPTASFKEINDSVNGVLALTDTPNYYELVRLIKTIDSKRLVENEIVYKQKYNYKQASAELIALYKDIVDEK